MSGDRRAEIKAECDGMERAGGSTITMDLCDVRQLIAEIEELRNCGVTLDSTKRVKVALEKAVKIADEIFKRNPHFVGKQIVAAIRAMAEEVQDVE